MEFTGERVVPGDMAKDFVTYQEHLLRYTIAVEYAVGKSVADIACGCGYGLAVLAGVAKEIWGIDKSQEAIDFASKLNYYSLKPHLRCLDLDKDRLPKKHFDLIVSFETIEHLEKPTRFLSWCRTHCDTFVFSIPKNLANPFHKKTYTFEDAKSIVEPYFDVDWSGQFGRVNISKENVDSAQYFIGIGKPRALETKTEQMVKLHIGCGYDIREGYHNIDPYTGLIKMSMDSLDYDNDSVDEILSIHSLEHVGHGLEGQIGVPHALQEWHRVLKPGGKVFIDVPDAEECARRWLVDDDLNSFWIKALWGLQSRDGDFHSYGFKKTTIRQLLDEAGFSKIQITQHESHGAPSLMVVAEKPRSKKGFVNKSKKSLVAAPQQLESVQAKPFRILIKNFLDTESSKNKDFTVKSQAKKLGCSDSHMRRLLKGEKNPSVKIMEKAAQTLGIQPLQFQEYLPTLTKEAKIKLPATEIRLPSSDQSPVNR
ncbi:MAG: methyltransferase domain-containing protein [Actinomycetota bacterium]